LSQVKQQPGSVSVVQGITEDCYGIGYSGIGYLTSGVRVVPLAANMGGTGLGLSIVRHIIQAHGEKVWVESELSKGTTFAFNLKTVCKAISPPWGHLSFRSSFF
jgi:hypothetical protein